MNTKLAIELLTQSHNDLKTFLTGLGLLNNETAIAYFKTVFDAAFQVFLDEYDDLKAKVNVTSSQIETIEDSLTLADDYHRFEEERLQELMVEKNSLIKEINEFKKQKKTIEKIRDSSQENTQINSIKEEIKNNNNKLWELQKDVNNKDQLIIDYQNQINDLIEQESSHRKLAEKYHKESTYIRKVRRRENTIVEIKQTNYNKIKARDEQYALADLARKKSSNLEKKIKDLEKNIQDNNSLIDNLIKKIEKANLSIEKLLESETNSIKVKINTIKKEISKTESDLWERDEKISSKKRLIIDYQNQINNLIVKESSHIKLAEKYNKESTYIQEIEWRGGPVSRIRTDYNKIKARDEQYALAKNTKKQADNLVEKLTSLNKEIEQDKLFIEALKNQLISYSVQLEAQKDLLSLSKIDIVQKLELIELQIQQNTEDLERLNNQDIFEQETVVNNANQKLSDLQSELQELKATAILAETELTDFETINAYLLAEDVTGFLDWNIDEDTPEVVKLWQQYLAVEGEEIISERVTSLQSQATSEDAVTVALEADSIEGYIILGADLAEEIESLSAIWLENLQESHQLTVDVWNLSEQRTEAVNELESYIEDNLADPEGDYLLDKIQLQEAIARQEAQINYADALGESVDSLEEAIAVLTTQQQQVNLLSEKIDHISTLTSLEKEYARLGSQASDSLRSDLIEILNEEIDLTQQDLIIEVDLSDEQQEQWLETNLHKYIEQKQNHRPQQEIKNLLKTNQEQAISSLQNLRVETAYLTLQAAQNPDKLENYLQAYLASDKTEASLNQLRNQYYPALSDATTLYNLQQQITDELTNSQQQLETLKAQIAQKQANATAALSQADWYEEQAAIHWENSRKAGPTWTEYRKAKGKSGRSETVAVTHVDHHWITWDSYTKQATNLRKHAANLDQEVIEDTQQQNLTDQLIAQWQEANVAADTAELTLDQFIAELELLEAQRQLLPEQEAQLETFSELLPTLKEQLAIAQLAAEEAKTNTATEQNEYDSSSQTYQTALNDVLEKKATLDTNTQNLLQQIANTRTWVEQQSLFLDTELSETIALQLQLQTQLDTIAPESETKTIQLQQSIDLLSQKQIILTAQQTALTQKITLLDAQKTVIETEHQLLLSTIDSPDSDYSNLENQLLDAQNALAEVQQLAQQAEATSIALTASMEDLQAFLEVQNDQYLSEIQAKHSTLQQLLDATALKENYSLLATEKQLQLNTLETQLQTRLIEATEAGSQEAAYLLTVAQQNNFATAAEIYYRDYRDLMTDTGGGCAGGIARPDDALKADHYYHEMLKHLALQEQAQQQADQFAIVKEAAQEHIDLIQQQQAIAQTEFNDIQSNISNTQEDIESLQQQLNIAELRIDALEYLRNWTEQTLVQLLQVEQLNLAQATLEQEFAQQRQLGIDESITAKFEKQQADIARDRAIATAKIEQLNQLQAEDALQQALNDLRTDLGLQPIEDIIQQAEYKGQLAGILSELETIKTQPELPENIQTILAETTADIHDALQGKEAETIQENLLNSANALITEANELQTEIAKLDEEEEQLLGILNQSETDLQGATKALYDEIIRSQELGEETDEINQDYLEVLYKIGYAEGAVDLSSELAKQSKDILNQIIEGRIQERKARKKAFVNELLGTVTLVISVVAAVYTAGAALSAFAGAIGQGATFAAATSIAATAASTAATGTFINTLTTIGASLSAVQSAYNGDWSGAIFNAGMAALGAANIANPKAELGLGGIQSFKDAQQVASGLYYGYQATESGDNLSALLNVFSAALPIGNLTEYNYLSQAAFSINSGVQLAEEDEWLAATSNFLNAAFTLADNLSETFGDDLAVSTEVLDILSRVELAVNIGDGVQTISDDGSLEGWLRGVQGIAGGVTNYFQEQKEIEQKEEEEEQEKENDDNTDNNEDNQNDTETGNDDHSSGDTGNENQDNTDTVDDTSSDNTGNENQDNTDTVDDNSSGDTGNENQDTNNKDLIKDILKDAIDVLEDVNNARQGLSLLYKDPEELLNENARKLLEDGREIRKYLNEKGELVVDYISNKVEKVVDYIDDNGHKVVEYITKTGEKIVDYIDDNGHKVVEYISETGKKVINYVDDNSHKVVEYISETGYKVVDYIDRNGSQFINYIDKNGGKVVEYISKKGDKVVDYIDKNGSILIEYASQKGDKVVNYIDKNGGKVVEYVSEKGEKVINYIDKNGGKVVEYVSEKGEKLVDYLYEKGEKIAKHPVFQKIEKIDNALGLGKIGGTIGLALNSAEIALADTAEERNVKIASATGAVVGSFMGSVFGPPGIFVGGIVGESVGETLGEWFFVDPLIIDLENNGIKLTSILNSSTFFDIDGDGYAENTAWVSPEDALLTIDLNQDGTINNITEVFSEYFNDGSPNSGLDALATLDSNQNGIISATDTQFNQILVWQDINQDGISQPDELKTLIDHGITSINLNGITTETIQDGNIIKQRSIFNRNDGTSGEISDIAFLVTQTGFKVNQTDTGIEILAEDDTAVSLFIHEDETGLTLNLADTNLQVAIGNIGNDYLYTTANNDIFLSGEAGDDTLVGSNGNDWLVGDEGSDRLEGNAGDDLLYIDAQDNFIDGGDGTDIAIVTTAEAVTLDLGAANLEMVIGNDEDDTFTHSGNYTVVMDGGNGNDSLTGGSNDDVLTGGEGDDFIQGSNGSDRIEGSQGNDNLHGWVGSDEIYGGLDNDTLHGQQDNDSLYGDEGDDQLHGNEGDDSLEGGAGLDTLYGHQGNDTLLGNIGDDQLYGDAGDDSLQGGEGNDQLFGNIGHDILEGNQGDDLIYGEEGNDTISGNDGNDQLHGWNGADILKGGDGEDTLYGHFDDDTLIGGENSDRLFGDQGNDSLDGNSGNDIITGGIGSDVLTGGNDLDIFVYNNFDDSTTTNPDRITDFETGDRIDFSNLPLNSFNDLSITKTEGITTISVNNQDFAINFDNDLTLTPEDFIFNEISEDSFTLTLNGTTVSYSDNSQPSYANQHIVGNLTFSDNTAILEGNTWKVLGLNYN
nr:hypothetical protein [Crocosphaera sp.]